MTNAVNIAQSGANNVTMRNRIINPGMVIDQRNNGASTANAPDGAYIADRWRYEGVGGKATIGQNLNSITPPVGFSRYAGVQVTSAYSIGVNESVQVGQWIEGFNTADLNLGTANAAQFTISFWVRSSVTGNYSVGLLGFDGTTFRNYAASYTINSANTWEQKTIVVQGDTATTITYSTTNGFGLFVSFALAAGSNLTVTANTWGTGLRRGVTGTTNLLATNGATWYATGVQLEKGTAATAFEQRLYGTELALCQRYYQTDFRSTCSGAAEATTSFLLYSGTRVTMRTNPTLIRKTTTTLLSIAGTINDNGGWNYTNGNPNGFAIAFAPASGTYTFGLPVQVSNDSIALSAEL